MTKPQTNEGYLSRSWYYGRDAWTYRHFWWSLFVKDLSNRYRRSLLGVGWSLLSPIAMTIVLCLVFHRLLKADVTEYLPCVLSGLAFWNFVSSSVLGGSQAFLQADQYIRQEPAPNAIYPLRTVLGAGFQFLISFFVAILLAAATHKGLRPLPMLTLLPTLVLLFLLTLSLATLAAFANVFLRDTQHICEVGLTLVFYMTPILYPARLLRSEGLGWLLNLNPLAAFVQLLQRPILQGTIPEPSLYITAGAATGVLLITSLLLCLRLDREVVFYL
jgi:ABC-type polysaccharide/polyol phosphate export permease